MIVTFPHMGHMHIVLKALFTGLGCKVLTPPPNSKRTLEIGTKLSPETVCLPFKMTLGNFIEAIEQGADTLITCGGVGPCRLGYYAGIQQEILDKMGYSFNMLTVEPDVFSVYANLRRIAPDKSWKQVYDAFRLAGIKMTAIDDLERELNRIRPRAVVPADADAIICKAIMAIDLAEDRLAVRSILEQALSELKNLPLKKGFVPLRIALVGEIYVVLEPFINQNLEKRLGAMGIEVHKTLCLSDYVRSSLLKKRDYLEKYEQLFFRAKPYLGHYVGGHGLKSIVHTIDKGLAGFDGIIQAYPFTCMPEVIAKNILPQVSRDYNIPVLTLAFDEQTGEAGIVTRLEAFVDLLKYRRKQKPAAKQV